MSAFSRRSETPEARHGFSRPLDVDKIPDSGLETTIEATEAECAAAAAEIGLPGVGALAARYTITRRSGDRLQVEGALTARITQICSVSLDPFECEIDEPIDVTFAPVSQPLPDRHIGRTQAVDANSRGRSRATPSMPAAPSVVVGEDDPPDPIVDGRIDLGALAVEFLTLALDFYPRKPGVQFDDVAVGATDEPRYSSFAALERFKDRS